jgi:hypothetical protein
MAAGHKLDKDMELQRFADIGFEDFRRMARDVSLSPIEKVGFPDHYRAGKEEAIFADIRSKVRKLDKQGVRVLDIGPGCSALPHMLITACLATGGWIGLVDSAEMLALLPDGAGIEKFACRFPQCPQLLERCRGQMDVILCYSVLHYIFAEGNVWDFLDQGLQLLAPGGEMLIGDIPNISMRKRFFSSDTGVRFHQSFTGRDEIPQVRFSCPEPGKIDDAVIFALLQRARGQGFDAYVLPQADGLPMANRREDILIRRP